MPLKTQLCDGHAGYRADRFSPASRCLREYPIQHSNLTSLRTVSNGCAMRSLPGKERAEMPRWSGMARSSARIQDGGGSGQGCRDPTATHFAALEPSVETSGLNAESGIREDSVRLAKTICSINPAVPSHSWVLSGIAVVSSIHKRYPYGTRPWQYRNHAGIRRFKRVLGTSWISRKRRSVH